MTQDDSHIVIGQQGGAAVRPARPGIVWQDRQGHVAPTAFWMTVFHVIARNGRLGRHMEGPVDYRRARGFRDLAALHVLFLPLAGLLGCFVQRQDRRLAPMYAVAMVVWPMLAAIFSGVATWFFCPRGMGVERQNRAIALSQYLAAPLALCLPLSLVIGAIIKLVPPGGLPMVLLLMMLALAAYWLQLILCGMRSIARRPAGAIAASAVAMPVLWAVVGLAVALLLPGIVMLVLMWASLT